MDTKRFFIETVRCALNGETVDTGDFSDWKGLCRYLSLQNAWSFAHFALEKSSAPDEVKNLIESKFLSVVNQQVLQEYYQGLIFGKLDEENVGYLPFKGARLRRLYPHAEMRVSCDVDFMVRLQDVDRMREVMGACGLTLDRKAGEADHDVWHADGGVTVEPHKSVMGLTDFSGYFVDFWDRTYLAGNNSACRLLKPEDEYIFLIAHALKHFIHGGCGVKTLTDVKLFRKNNPDMDEEYLSAEFAKIKAVNFEKSIVKLADLWLDGGEFDENSLVLTDFIFDGGLYGTGKSQVAMKAGTDGKSAEHARRKYVTGRLFPPYKVMKVRYPVLNKHPILLPFCWIARIFNAIFTRRDTIKRNLRDCGNLSAEDVDRAAKVYDIITDD